MPRALESVDESSAADYSPRRLNPADDFSPRVFQPAPSTSELATVDAMLTSLPSLTRSSANAFKPSSLDCTDRSVNLWETLLPLQSTSAGQALDVIAP